MRHQSIRRAAYILLALALLVPGLAFGQYDPATVLDRTFQGRVLDVGRDVQAQHPAAWRHAHDGSEPSGTEFVRRWALALRASGVLACVNGKRGSETLSQDVLAFPVTSGWARDTSGRYAGRIMVVDVIIGAGAAGASLSFGPDTSGADGRCIDPVLEASESGTEPAPGPGPGQPPPAASPVDLTPVLTALAALQRDVSEIKARPMGPSDADLTMVWQYINAMVGDGPDGPGPLPPHITDVKERLDVIRQLLEQLNAWLRARPIFRF